MDHNVYTAALPESGTWFAPAERVPAHELRNVADNCLHNPVTRAILASVEGYVLILNEQRQVLAANPTVLTDLKVSSSEQLLGLRPGEAFGCIHSCDTPGGCGTSKSCSTCGAVISILSSRLLNQPATGECLMSVGHNGAFEAHEFTVRATPLQIADSLLTVFVIHDISSAKRRDALENIFIHDLNNIITGLRGWSEILAKRPQDSQNIAQRIVNLSTHLTREVDNQRILLQAERGDLQVDLESLPVNEILENLRAFFSGYPPDSVQRLIITDDSADHHIKTCQPLIIRVLANMIKNALEATAPPDQVRVRFVIHDGMACFSVHNPGDIPEAVALQIFKRSFSTKGTPGRGLGTYSMKLLGEKYLGGTVGFSSVIGAGTSFYINLPMMA